MPSWEWFAEAAADDAGPLYRVEPARSGRSKCGAKGKAVKHGDEFIAQARAVSLLTPTRTIFDDCCVSPPILCEQGEVRVGSYDEVCSCATPGVSLAAFIHSDAWHHP